MVVGFECEVIVLGFGEDLDLFVVVGFVVCGLIFEVGGGVGEECVLVGFGDYCCVYDGGVCFGGLGDCEYFVCVGEGVVE